MAHESIVDLTSENFASEAKQSSVPVLIDFWSEHCGPCKMLSPVLDEVAQELDGKAKVTKVDVMNQRDLAMEYGVRAVPTLVFMKGGEVPGDQDRYHDEGCHHREADLAGLIVAALPVIPLDSFTQPC